VVFGYEALRYLLHNMPNILLPVAVLGSYVICLVIVAFFFACAAQFKTADGYWWRNTLCGRFFRFCYSLTCWLEKVLRQKAFPLLGRILRKVWQLLVQLWQFFCKACVWFYYSTEKGLGWLFATLGKAFRWMGSKIVNFFSLLPLMWQWLLTGAVMLITVTFALLTRSEGLLVLSLCASFAIILYGASCFGTLLEATKRMGKGDLETQVSDKNLVGSFKEFAGDLNALADVAVVAARNQLKSERMKTELITNVSHDIKTPLTSIINYVDLLQKPHSDEEQEAYLEVLSRQSNQLKKLIDDLMEMSKASTGNMAVDITAVDAVEAVNQALGEFSDKFERIRLTPVFRQPEEPVYMKADGRLAWRVLSNLLSNAYKYALPGTRLYIDLMELEGKVLISLKNISREELNVSADELLERFVRGDISRNTEGSGLGLNIAQSLMELQKGQLQLLVDGDLFKATLIFPSAKME
jgi:signal transduction histidine kinase